MKRLLKKFSRDLTLLNKEEIQNLSSEDKWFLISSGDDWAPYIEWLLEDEDEEKRAVIVSNYFNDLSEQWKQKLSNDPSPYVRAELARGGYDLEKFSTDPDDYVRYQVAKHGVYLDRLVNDPDFTVRQEVAKQGAYTDELVFDPDPRVRRTVADKGEYLNILINDPDYSVRLGVAFQNYGLDILVNDENERVRDAAKRALNKLKRNKKR